MTHEEAIIKFLRERATREPVMNVAADMIEQLVKERDEAIAAKPKGMSVEEAKAYLEQANRERPLGRSWQELERMQGGRLK